MHLDSLAQDTRRSPLQWLGSGEPLVWLNAAAVAISVLIVVGLLLLLATRGAAYFWPRDVLSATLSYQGLSRHVSGEVVEQVAVPAGQLRESGIVLSSDATTLQRTLIKQGGRDVFGSDFVWVLDEQLSAVAYPADVVVVERLEWGKLYGKVIEVGSGGQVIARWAEDPAATWAALQAQQQQAAIAREEAITFEREGIEAIKAQADRLSAAELDAEYRQLAEQLRQLRAKSDGDYFRLELADGRQLQLALADVVRSYRPNTMTLWHKLQLAGSKVVEFLTEGPREANTEGGVFPAIVGTSLMVILMSIMVMPFGVVAAVYLSEYAHQGLMTRLIRIAVNNLAGVPSIVYGVFGLGFFIYAVGGRVDELFFSAALPNPTFGTPGLLWASLTLALLTLPVVIVATEEGLARIPGSLRDGSLALGATRAETLWRLVLPMATPAMMTGLILAVARAAGEVAPLMLVGVVKTAPALPLDGNFPYLHLDQKFMHLGFHIYDVGFQSPNVEAAKPLVYATALLLVMLIGLLNLVAVTLRNHLRERYRALDH